MEKQKLKQAWDAFFESQRTDDLDALRKEGWLTIQDILTQSGERGIEIDHRRAKYVLDNDTSLEKKQIKTMWDDGKVRKANVYRPKV